MRTNTPRFAATRVREGSASSRPAFVIIAVLLVVALLALAAYQYVEMMTTEYRNADTASRAAQARASAAAGIYYTAAMLSNTDSFNGTLNGNPYDNEGPFHGISLGGSDSPRKQPRFSIVAPPDVDEATSGDQTIRYGVIAENSMININAIMQVDRTGQKLHDMLMMLPNMTEEIADAIVDWIDADDTPRANGAESDYYSGIGYRCKNGPLDSIEELLLVRGVTPDLLFGIDKNRNGLADPEETQSGEPFDRGWSAYLTVFSRERNVDSTGAPRININDTALDADTLHQNLVEALGSPELADFIIAYRVLGAAQTSGGGGGGGGGGGATTTTTNSNSLISYDMLTAKNLSNNIPSLYALVNAQVGITRQVAAIAITSAAGGARGGGGVTATFAAASSVTTLYKSPLADPAAQEQILPILLDKCTTRPTTEIPARVNVMTAPRAVLTALPGLEDTDVDMILNVRPSPESGELDDPLYQTPAWLLTDAGITIAKLQALERYICSNTQVYRIQSVGYFDQGGPWARIEAVVDTNGGKPRIVYWRNLSELGRGFEIAK